MEKLSSYTYSDDFEPIIKARYEETIPEFVEKIGGTITQTSALRGAARSDARTRSEVMSLLTGGK